MKSLMWKLLKKHISKTQMAGFALANIIGLTIVLLGIQFYQDVRPIFEDEDSFMRKDYLVITKHVGNMSMIGSLLGGKPTIFSENELSDLKSQKWVSKVGEFTTCNYRISGSISVADRGLRSSFFFESVPDEFIDIKSEDWTFDPTNPQIPIIVSKDYLSLYNFGFATSQGMPQLSESMIGKVPIIFRLSGDDGTEQIVQGRIVGFSNRLNTIIVPDAFMSWSNNKFAPNVKSQPARLIVEVSSPGDPEIEKYMKAKGYEIAGDKMNSSKANLLLTIIMSIVIAVGLVICTLSFFILILSIYLLLQKNTQKLQNLLLLGYSPSQVSGMYVKMVVYINIAVLILSFAILLTVRATYLPILNGFTLTGASLLVASLAGLALMVAITAGNIIAIRRKVNSLWLLEK